MNIGTANGQAAMAKDPNYPEYPVSELAHQIAAKVCEYGNGDWLYFAATGELLAVGRYGDECPPEIRNRVYLETTGGPGFCDNGADVQLMLDATEAVLAIPDYHDVLPWELRRLIGDIAEIWLDEAEDGAEERTPPAEIIAQWREMDAADEQS